MDTQTPVSMSSSDPTTLTTQQLWREIAALKELALMEIASVKKAVDLAHADSERFPTEIQQAVGNLKELYNEKFNGVEKQFQERDIRIQNAKSSADNALMSAEKFVDKQSITLGQSISKSESSIMKQIELLGEKVNDIKDRLTTIEGQSSGKRDFWGYIIGAIGLIATVISILIFMSKLKTG